MTEARDAVEWTVLQGWDGPVMGYVDGPVSMWPPEAWQFFQSRPSGHITVLANPDYEIFDVELGNASAVTVAGVVADRLADRLWSLVYLSESTLAEMSSALRLKSLRWMDAGFWPMPGVYLFAADWTEQPHLDVPWAPVRPLAVQWHSEAQFDQSSCFGAYLAPTGPSPAPVPVPAHPDKERDIMVLANDGPAQWIVYPTDQGLRKHLFPSNADDEVQKVAAGGTPNWGEVPALLSTIQSD